MTAWVSGSGSHRVESFARDAAGNLADGGATGRGPAAATVRIDEVPPVVAFAAAQDAADPERIEAHVRDELSGPSPDRGWIGVRPAGTRVPFEPLPTQVGAGRLAARWDSDSYPAGKYEFLATAYDAAGNPGSGTDRARGGRMVLVTPLKTPTSLAGGFASKERSNQLLKRVPYGREARFAGRLAAPGGGVAGLPVEITETFAAGSKPSRRVTTVHTGAGGAFSARLAPGPSREVVAGFAGNRTLTRASGDPARLEVPTSVRLRASAPSARVGGPPIVFSGRVGGAGIGSVARAAVPVELEFRFRGAGWREFRTVETDRRGRFRYRYRFSDDDSRGIRFQFRANVKGREGWPYEPSASRPVLVTGR